MSLNEFIIKRRITMISEGAIDTPHTANWDDTNKKKSEMWKICHTNKKCNPIHLSLDFIIIAISAEHNAESIDHTNRHACTFAGTTDAKRYKQSLNEKQMREKMKTNTRLNEIETKLRPYYPCKTNGNVYLFWIWCVMRTVSINRSIISFAITILHEYYIRLHQYNIAEYSTRIIGRTLREQKCARKKQPWWWWIDKSV